MWQQPMIPFLVVLMLVSMVQGFVAPSSRSTRGLVNVGTRLQAPSIRRSDLQMNFFEDAVRFFSNMKKEASAKHILIKGADASSKLEILKKELEGADDLSAAFSELASKVSECPSANRGGNLGTFKPGMMVKEFDRVCFEKEVGVVHGPIQTQFGAHLILITRRYEGEDEGK
jgi:peptidyl-prolyl cis-trans isomerase C